MSNVPPAVDLLLVARHVLLGTQVINAIHVILATINLVHHHLLVLSVTLSVRLAVVLLLLAHHVLLASLEINVILVILDTQVRNVMHASMVIIKAGLIRSHVRNVTINV